MKRKKSDRQKALEGNPGHRRLRTARGVNPIGDLVRPSYVIGHAREVWDRCVAAMPGVYAPTDSELLAAYCTACAAHREAASVLLIEGAVTIGPRGAMRRNPWAVVATQARAQIDALGRRLGLDPTSRADLPPPTTSTSSKFAGLVGIDPETNDGDDND